MGGVGSREGIAAANFGMRPRRSQSVDVEQAGGGGLDVARGGGGGGGGEGGGGGGGRERMGLD